MKTFIKNLAFCATLSVFLSGCMDFDFGMDWGSGFGGGLYYGAGYYDPTYYGTFYLDSITQESDSKVTMWGTIRYDSILTIENRSVSYLENGIQINRVLQSQPETINFRQLPDSMYNWTGRYEYIYNYSVEIDSLQKNIDYAINLVTNYTERGEYRSAYHYLYFRLY